MSLYDEIELEDLTYSPELQLYTYPCPCGDQFQISLGDMKDGEDIAVCPSCSLTIRVIFDQDDLSEPEAENAEKTGEAQVAVKA